MEWKNSNPFNISFLLCISLFLYFFPPESTMVQQPMLQLWGLWRLLFLLTYLCFYCPKRGYLCVFFSLFVCFLSKKKKHKKRGAETAKKTTITETFLYFSISWYFSVFLSKYIKGAVSFWRALVWCGRARQGCALNKRGGGRLPMGVYKPPTSLLGPG